MPTLEDLARLRALLARLSDIGDVQRGELIRAEDWNSLVAAVVDLVQAVFGAEASLTVAPHEHLDQVTIDWLSPLLRQLIERGPLADPATQSRLFEIEQKQRRLADQVELGRVRVDEFKGRMTDVISRDLEREAAVTNVRRAIDNVADPRVDILSMRTTLASVQRDLGNVLAVASQLNVNGRVVDLAELVAQVSELDRFREGMRLATGALLDANGIEQELARIRNESVSEEELDRALADLPTSLPDNVLESLEDRLAAGLSERTSRTLEAFGAELRAEVTGRLASVDQLVAARIEDALPGLEKSVLASVAPEIEAAKKSAIEGAAEQAKKALDERERALRSDFSGQLDQLKIAIEDAIEIDLDQKLATDIGVVRTELGAISARLDATALQSGRHEEQLRLQSLAIARIPFDTALLRNELRQMVSAEIELRTQTLTRTIDERLAAFEKAEFERSSAALLEVQRAAVAEASRAAAETANKQARELRGQLLAEMRVVAREETALALRTQPAVVRG